MSEVEANFDAKKPSEAIVKGESEDSAQPLDLSVKKNQGEMPLQTMLLEFLENQLATAHLLSFLSQSSILGENGEVGQVCPTVDPTSRLEKHSVDGPTLTLGFPRRRRDSVDSAASYKRNEANARERNRVQQLSEMFEKLRVALPVPVDFRISKLSTLKVATRYIDFLGTLLDEDASNEKKDAVKARLFDEIEASRSLRR